MTQSIGGWTASFMISAWIMQLDSGGKVGVARTAHIDGWRKETRRMRAKRVPIGEGWCPSCGGERKRGEWEDMGIGAYEYWGAKGTHHDWQLVCPDCGEIMEDVEEVDFDPY